MKSCINGATTMPYSLEQDLQSAAEAGFEAVEIWAPKLEKYLETKTVQDLKNQLKDYNLKAASLCPYGLGAFGEDKEENTNRIREAAQIAAAIGCNVLLVCPDSPPAGMSERKAFGQAARVARNLAQASAEYEVNIALEPLGMHPFVPGPEEALRIVQQAGVDNLGIMMDTFHYYKSGISAEAIGCIPIEKLLIVHVNDCEDLPKEVLNDGHRLYPGLGVIPLGDMLGAIKANGYQGFLSVEIFRQEYWKESPDVISFNSKKYLEKVLSELP